VFIVVGKLFGKLLVLEADGNRVDINFLDVYSQDSDAYYEIYRLPIQEQMRLHRACDFTVNKFANVKYGRGQIVGIVLNRIGAFFGQKQKNQIDDGIVCSELGLYYLRSCGLKVLETSDPNLVEPFHIRQAVIELGGYLVGNKRFTT